MKSNFFPFFNYALISCLMFAPAMLYATPTVITAENLPSTLFLGGRLHLACMGEEGRLGKLEPPRLEAGSKFKPLNAKRQIRLRRAKLAKLKASLRRIGPFSPTFTRLTRQKRALQEALQEIKTALPACLEFAASLRRASSSSSEGNASSASSSRGQDPGLYLSSITQHGITWTFDKSYRAGQFVNGDWWVAGPVSIVKIDPVSNEYPGETIDGSPRIMHGSMLNPAFSGSQGFDSYMCKYPNGYDPHYEPALNAAMPNGRVLSPENPLVISKPSAIISTISRTIAELKADHTSSNKQTLRTAAVLTVLDEAPAEGSFRPPYANVSKQIRFHKDQLDYSILKNLPHVANMPVLKEQPGSAWYESLEGTFARIPLDLCNSSVCSWNPLESVQLYGRDLSRAVAEAVLMLNLDFSNQEKETLFVRLVQLGIDQAGIFAAGGYWPSNGGIYSGRKLPILLAGRALNDPYMKEAGKWRIHVMYSADPLPITRPFQDDGQIFYVSQTNPQQAFSSCIYETSPHDINLGCGGYSSEHLGLPEYGIRHQQNPRRDSIAKDAPYRGVNLLGYIPTAIAVQVMELTAEWDNNSFFDYADRFWQISCDEGACGSFGNSRVSYFVKNMWNAYRRNYGCSYVGLDVAYHTRGYNCADAEFNCFAVPNCGFYPNERARKYDPCQLDCR